MNLIGQSLNSHSMELFRYHAPVDGLMITSYKNVVKYTQAEKSISTEHVQTYMQQVTSKRKGKDLARSVKKKWLHWEEEIEVVKAHYS